MRLGAGRRPRLGGSTTDLQERLESSTAGRVMISAVILVVLAAVGVTTMPASTIRTHLSVAADPVLRATGLDQNWAIFSPDPRRSAVYVEARVDHPDGSVTTWPIITDRFLGEYTDYRWHKFEEDMWLDPGASWSWAGYARWVAQQDRAAGHRPSRVSLVRHWSDSAPPGTPTVRGPWHEQTFFSRPVVIG
ncbi:hypothetical protein LQ327_15535 [Actinomycetospora endophytica]|uniref:Uncharacterized protein n=1 Tax=Actinomycetospora endophytica TaxID=2291215 RepID=A0ABS8PCQ8_9PSEU|nr:hypothetical protein [Actinomycetospora endophytica]MCD2194784.1 hypothetical protein [Actinomycetospora endophytica]